MDVFLSPDSDVPFAAAVGDLTDALEAWARGRDDLERLTAFAYDYRPDQLAFWNDRGWRETERDYEVGVDPAAVELPEPRADVVCVTLADRPDLFPAVHEVHEESWFATPFATNTNRVPYERWKEHVDLWPGNAPEWFVVLLEGDEVIGMADLDFGGLPNPEVAWHGYLGVRPAHQGRGLGTELKVRTIRLARELGVRRLFANNNSENVRMRAINARFGYERQFAYVGFERRVSRS